MIVCLAGPSGSGKTTLAKAIAKKLDWEFVEQSAGLILNPNAKEEMKERWGYNGNLGQQGVINLSHEKREFGRFFQQAVLDSRVSLFNTLLLKPRQNFIFDRSPLDPAVFYLNQVVHNDDQLDSERFLVKCFKAMKLVDIVIRVPLQNPNRDIENNGSRVNNWYFQNKIDGLYDSTIRAMINLNNEYPKMLGNKMLKISRVSTWDWETRLKEALEIIERT